MENKEEKILELTKNYWAELNKLDCFCSKGSVSYTTGNPSTAHTAFIVMDANGKYGLRTKNGFLIYNPTKDSFELTND